MRKPMTFVSVTEAEMVLIGDGMMRAVIFHRGRDDIAAGDNIFIHNHESKTGSRWNGYCVEIVHLNVSDVSEGLCAGFVCAHFRVLS